MPGDAVPGREDSRGGLNGSRGTVAGRPGVLRSMNERLLLEQVRVSGPISRPELAASSGLSKPTVGLALSALEEGGLVRVAGVRTGVRGPAALLYELRPEAGYVLGLDVGREYLRAALADLTGTVRARVSRKAASRSAAGRVGELAKLADEVCNGAAVRRSKVTQVVVGSPGVYDPARRALTMARNFPGWESPGVVQGLEEVFGRTALVENDVDLAALAERDLGHGREVPTFCVLSVGTGIGMGLVINGQLHRGAHGVAGEIAYLPLGDPADVDPTEVRRHGQLEAVASAAAVVRAARRRGLAGPLTARRVFAAATEGNADARAVVSELALLVAQTISSVVAVIDPHMVVLGGGIGRAPGFASAVADALVGIAPVVPEIRVSGLGDDAVVDGAISAGTEIAWRRVLEQR